MKIELEVNDPQRLLADLSAAIEATGNGKVSHRLRDLQGVIDAQIPEPRIPEPGMYGVVRDSGGWEWVRAGAGIVSSKEWRSTEDGSPVDWDDIDLPTLVREGI